VKKVMAGLDAEQREALLYVADLGVAVGVAALVVGCCRPSSIWCRKSRGCRAPWLMPARNFGIAGRLRPY
jgi:hypothetical protein